jgi:hypothetical protein
MPELSDDARAYLRFLGECKVPMNTRAVAAGLGWDLTRARAARSELAEYGAVEPLCKSTGVCRKNTNGAN